LYFYFATFFGLLEDIKVAALYGTLYLLFLSNTKDAQFSCSSRKKDLIVLGHFFRTDTGRTWQKPRSTLHARYKSFAWKNHIKQ
jgi:hypothetical protein